MIDFYAAWAGIGMGATACLIGWGVGSLVYKLSHRKAKTDATR